MGQETIDDLIWGKFESEIIKLEIPLWTFRYPMKSEAMNGVYALFNGFLTFLLYKHGYKPKLPEDFKVDLDDNSWWVKNLDDPKFMNMNFPFDDDNGENLPPFVFKQFVNEIGKDITIFILLDWHTFYECGLALKKSKLSEDEKYTEKIKEEFHLSPTKNFDLILNYMKELNNKDFADMHKLILRPDKIADYIFRLNDSYYNLDSVPDDLHTKEVWEKMSDTEKFARPADFEFVYCTENNFKQLLEKAGITIPNVEFQSFNNFQEKFDLSIINDDWSKIRDKFISKLKDFLIDSDDLTNSKDHTREKELLQKAQDFFERKEFEESKVNCCKSIEGILSKKYNLPTMSLWNMINRYREDPSHSEDIVDYLFTIGKRRNKKGAHFDKQRATEADARLVLEMTNYVFRELTGERISGKYDTFEK
jgi:hypothetical protein